MFSPDSKLGASFSLISGGVSSSPTEEPFSSILSQAPSFVSVNAHKPDQEHCVLKTSHIQQSIDTSQDFGSSRMTHWGLPGMFGWAGGMCMCHSVIRMPHCENIVVLDLCYE